ncbi:Retrovirus-related Pol polyprotein from transposon 17.6 [Cucumis melo var. makuwa]|uniref:Retrovirus-related Pol polyprotein from transposon 17.6 n=1 Tax=Cucumis melo var. makuwa TaxID=1194695 RepID=A0A5D3C9B3_CUCMM|nr:Retrovirus-related Pol polyprotein from transposon 17.6 [Cucumis melo var. makuwa]TYK07768.1 Retrovirus-related Pol polyprotein from transposon 17.6 [Cucumis melo var. makuwa]
MHLGRALYDLEENINLMPLSIFKKLEIRVVQPTDMRLQFADRYIQKHEGKIKDILVKVDKVLFPQTSLLCTTKLIRSVIESLGWDYCKEEAYNELFSIEEFIEDEDPNYVLEEVNVVSGERKFEPLGLQTKGDKKGTSSSYCMHKIRLKKGQESTIQFQRQLNLKMKEVVKKEIIKCLDAVENLYGYHKLNATTKKDHFFLSFIDQMLDRLAGKEFYCFLDGFYGDIPNVTPRPKSFFSQPSGGVPPKPLLRTSRKVAEYNN